MAAPRQNGAIRMGEVIDKMIARNNLDRLVPLPDKMSKPLTLQRAIASGLNAHLPPFRSRIDLSDEDETVRPLWPPRRPQM